MAVKKIIQNAWHGLTSVLKTYLLPALNREVVASGGALVKEAAAEAVKAMANTQLSNSEKFDAAVKAVTNVLITKGVSYTVTGVMGAVLDAYAEYKAGR